MGRAARVGSQTWGGLLLLGLALCPGIGRAGGLGADDLIPALRPPELGAAVRTSAAPAPAADLDYWLDGGRSIGLGLEHARIQLNTSSKLATAPLVPPTPVGTRLIDPDPNLDALTFDLKARWPTPSGVGLSSLQPFVSFGPALFVARPNDAVALGLPGDRQSVSLSLGLLGGAGLSWRLGENASLFGEYRFVQSGANRLLPTGGGGGTGSPSPPDLLYGISVRF